jgi:riboflavin synthase
MFTGIITNLAKIQAITHQENSDSLLTISLEKKAVKKTPKIGCSIACDGICLTLVSQKIIEGRVHFDFYASLETYQKTTLKNFQKNQFVNLEFSLKIGDELGGHLVLGHVDDTAKILDISPIKDSWVFVFELKENFKKFIVNKGSLTINGVSLTINNVHNNSFDVNIINHTFHNTTFQNLKLNDLVNLEIDVIARYVNSQLTFSNKS